MRTKNVVENKNICTIEGNRGGKVSYETYKKNFCSTTVTCNKTINGYYRPNYAPHYTVRYDANGETGFMFSQHIIYGNSTKLYGNSYERKKRLYS